MTDKFPLQGELVDDILIVDLSRSSDQIATSGSSWKSGLISSSIRSHWPETYVVEDGIELNRASAFRDSYDVVLIVGDRIDVETIYECVSRLGDVLRSDGFLAVERLCELPGDFIFDIKGRYEVVGFCFNGSEMVFDSLGMIADCSQDSGALVEEEDDDYCERRVPVPIESLGSGWGALVLAQLTSGVETFSICVSHLNAWAVAWSGRSCEFSRVFDLADSAGKKGRSRLWIIWDEPARKLPKPRSDYYRISDSRDECEHLRSVALSASEWYHSRRSSHEVGWLIYTTCPPSLTVEYSASLRLVDFSGITCDSLQVSFEGEGAAWCRFLPPRAVDIMSLMDFCHDEALDLRSCSVSGLLGLSGLRHTTVYLPDLPRMAMLSTSNCSFVREVLVSGVAGFGNKCFAASLDCIAFGSHDLDEVCQFVDIRVEACADSGKAVKFLAVSGSLIEYRSAAPCTASLQAFSPGDRCFLLIPSPVQVVLFAVEPRQLPANFFRGNTTCRYVSFGGKAWILGEKCFSDCPRLEVVVYRGRKPLVMSCSCFENCFSLAVFQRGSGIVLRPGLDDVGFSPRHSRGSYYDGPCPKGPMRFLFPNAKFKKFSGARITCRNVPFPSLALPVCTGVFLNARRTDCGPSDLVLPRLSDITEEDLVKPPPSPVEDDDAYGYKPVIRSCFLRSRWVARDISRIRRTRFSRHFVDSGDFSSFCEGLGGDRPFDLGD